MSPAPFQDRPPPCPILSQTAQTKRERWTREGKEGRTTDIFPVVVIVVEIRQIKERERGEKERKFTQANRRKIEFLPPPLLDGESDKGGRRRLHLSLSLFLL